PSLARGSIRLAGAGQVGPSDFSGGGQAPSPSQKTGLGQYGPPAPGRSSRQHPSTPRGVSSVQGRVSLGASRYQCLTFGETRGRADPVAARPPSPANLAAAPAGPLVGRGRRFVGQRELSITVDTYTHVLIDGGEVDYATLIANGD